MSAEEVEKNQIRWTTFSISQTVKSKRNKT
jgi:hypothetical protein